MVKHVLITGASSGIGKEFAERFAREGRNLLLVARNKPRLREIADDLIHRCKIKVIVIAKDLADPRAPGELFEEVSEQGIQVDVLVNNAGFGLYGPFSTTNLDQELNMITVNIRALTHLTKLFLPSMILSGGGGILNVASIASFQPGPLMAVYYATKAYVLSFSEALANELHGTGVTVTVLCPGPTETGFRDAANLSTSKFFEKTAMNATEVVNQGWKGFQSGKRVVIPGIHNQILALSVRFIPRKFVTFVVRKIQEKDKGKKNMP